MRPVRCRARLAAVGAFALLASCLGGAAACAAESAGSTVLDRYLENLATLRADFSQDLTDEKGHRVERVFGHLVVLRPGRFRWEVRPAGAAGEPAQLMIADGRNVWFYDRELDQVTVKPATGALTATPAMLLSGTVELRSAFTVHPAARRDGLDWVSVAPRRGDAEFREARLGFDALQLRRMELDDKLGQKTVIVFEHAERNGPVTPAEVSFTPPPGADVIGTPQP
jgi:outer membrane lipoprotein carrier protein